MKKLKILFVCSLFLFVGWNTCSAEIKPLVSNDWSCVKGGDNCTLNEMVGIGINVANIILAATGALSLLMFIIGGFMMLLSGGSSEMVEKGKKTLIGAVIGLIIIFSSYIIIKFVTEKLGGQFNGQTPPIESGSQGESGVPWEGPN